MSEKKESRCRGCNAVIKWGQKDGRSHPYNLDGESHFKTCPKRGDFVKAKTPTLRQVSDAVIILKARGVIVEHIYDEPVDKIIEKSKEQEAEEAPEWV